jgi:putative spermidine/putrescine transport system substrate-binding protein
VSVGSRRLPLVWVAAAVVALVIVTVATLAASSGSGSDSGTAAGESWDEVVAAAEGQTVRVWMWSGETALNDHIDRDVAPRADELGVTLERVPIEDTADAINRMAAEVDAGEDSGAVDLVWVNGTNFAQGKEAGLWLDGWTSRLPSAEYLDPEDPTLQTDFGVPVDGQELPWSRAAFVFAHDTARVTEPPGSFEELATYVREHPGRVTYPAPPDFTGSAFVRQAVQALGEDEAFQLLADMEPSLWQGGRNHPVDQAELDRLFAAGEVDLAMSYNPNFVDTAVRAGQFPDTVRPYVFEGGTLQNVSFVAIPANASHPEGAQVVAALLLSPEMQAAKLDRVGIPTVLDLDRVGDQRDAFEDAGDASPHLLDDLGSPLDELPVDEVPRLDERWLDEVAR